MKQTYANVLSGTNTNTVVTGPCVPIVGRELEMAPNRGGGYGFVTTWKTSFQRFLILGSDKGHYSSAKDNTKESIMVITTFLEEHGLEMVQIVDEIYTSGRAAKQDPTFVALALLCISPNLEVRKAAWLIVTKLRTFSHLCTFLKYYMESGGGWGRLPKKSLGTWVTKTHTARDLLYQTIKYLSRDGWTFRDLLRCLHINPTDLTVDQQMVLKLMGKFGNKNISTIDAYSNALEFGTTHGVNEEDLSYVRSIQFLKTCQEETADVTEEIIRNINKHNFTHEFLPKWSLNNKDVWYSLLLSVDGQKVKMPITALIRNLSTLTVRGLFEDSNVVTCVCNHLQNPEVIKKSRIHPATVAIAWKQYEAGHGLKGKQTWTPVNEICLALENTMYLAFSNVEATGKRIQHCFDGSGSMTTPMGTCGNMTSAEAVGLLGLICSRNEDIQTQQYCVFSSNRSTTNNSWLGSFLRSSQTIDSTGLRSLTFSPKSSLKEAARITQITDWSSTDCSLPIENKIKEFNSKLDNLHKTDVIRFTEALVSGDVDQQNTTLAALGIFLPEVFVIYTDNDVNSGKRHPSEALQEYRKITGINAKMAVVATQASNRTIADPKDSGMMDLVGFDSQLPTILSDFICGKI